MEGGSVKRKEERDKISKSRMENQGGENTNKKFGKHNVNRLLLSQHPMGIPNIAGVYGGLYGAWWCDPPSGV